MGMGHHRLVGDDLGPLQSWLPFNEQQHNVYAVFDFKIGRFDVNAGVGYGLTPGLDRLRYKMIIGTDLTEGVSDKSSGRVRRFEDRSPAWAAFPGRSDPSSLSGMA